MHDSGFGSHPPVEEVAPIGTLHDRVVALELDVIEAFGKPVVVLAHEQMTEFGLP